MQKSSKAEKSGSTPCPPYQKEMAILTWLSLQSCLIFSQIKKGEIRGKQCHAKTMMSEKANEGKQCHAKSMMSEKARSQ